MIYNLFLNSTTDTPLTNYYSAVLANDRGQRVYAVDWSFLPELQANESYEVSFRFLSKAGTFTANNLVYLTLTIGLSGTSVTGSNSVSRKNNRVLGMLKPRQASGTSDIQLSALASDNEPVSIITRPFDSFIEVKVVDNTGAQLSLTVDYILILSFKKVIS